jgi:aminopeptidase YwaD
MRHPGRLRALALLAALCVVRVAAAPEIRADRLLDHIKFLASDELKGRDTGSEGMRQAADYIAAQFKSAGLQPGWNGGWMQPFEVEVGLAIGRDNHLSVSSHGINIPLMLGTSYYPLGATPNDDRNAVSTELRDVPVVFAGYGLSVPRLSYDDYANIDVRDKAVLIFSHEPQEQDAASRLNRNRPLAETTLAAKARAARSRGARALLVVSDPSHRVDEANYRMFPFDPEADNVGLPVLRVRRDEMKPLLDAFGLEQVARDIDRDLVPRSRALPDTVVRYVEQLAHDRRTVGNVVGILPGSDLARASEAVVLGAHYDHVGLGGHNSAAPELTGEIHNGADDNASGTASIIEIARQAAQSRSRFPRTLVFVAFAAEERGLLGSAFYVRNAAFPIENSIAMLNLDMVGRSRGSVDISGVETGPALEGDLTDAMHAVPELRVSREGPGAGRSDDSSFLGRRVPAINFFTGFHPDYHKPTDDWDKIDVEGTRRVATLALELAARIAERPQRPAFVAPRN